METMQLVPKQIYKLFTVVNWKLNMVRFLSTKISSNCYDFMKLCHINHRGSAFFEPVCIKKQLTSQHVSIIDKLLPFRTFSVVHLLKYSGKT